MEKFPSLAPLRRLQNATPPLPPPRCPQPQLDRSTATGGLEWRCSVGRWRGGKGGKRVAFQNSFRVRQRLESSVAGERVAGEWVAVIAWENKHERATETRSPPPPPPPLQHATLGATPLLPDHEGDKMYIYSLNS